MMRCAAAAIAARLHDAAGAEEDLAGRWLWRDSSRFSESFMRGAAPWPSRSSGTKAAPSRRRP